MKFADAPLVCLISDGSIGDENYQAASGAFLNLLECAVSANIPLVQIREKQLSARLLFELTVRAVKIARDSHTRLLVNDRADIALAAEADGVHLTSRSVLPEMVRKYFPAGFVIGASTHSIEELESAVKGADFAVFGPVFESPGKASVLGLGALREAAGKFPDLPVLALGGIDETNYKKVIESGAAGFAAIRFLNNKQNLERLQREFEL